MDIKHVFDKMNQQLSDLEQKYTNEKIKPAQFHQELKQLQKQSEEILDEWIAFEDQLQTFQEGVPLSPVYEESNWLKGKAYYDLYMFNSAVPYFEDIVERYPDFEVGRFYLAQAYLASQQAQQAKYHFQFIIDTSNDNPMYQLAVHALGCIQGTQQDYDQALHYLNKMDVDQVQEEWKPIFVYNQAITLFQLRQFEESKAKFEQYYELVPDDWRGPFSIGKVYQQMGKEAEGFAYWFSALQIQESPHLLKAMAKQFEQKTYHQMAAQCYERILKGETRCMDVDVWFGLAWNTGLSGDQQKSRHIFLKALSLFPHHVELQLAYIWMLLWWKEEHRAMKSLQRIKSRYADQPLYKGLQLLSAGEYDAAHDYLAEQYTHQD